MYVRTAASVHQSKTHVKKRTRVHKRRDTNAVALEVQGTLLAVAARSNAEDRPGGGRRGVVTGFSDASRNRMLRKLARLDPRRITFITLTYPDAMTDDSQAYAHLRALFERFRRRWPQASGIWRKEYQDRGAIHFHLLMFGMPWYPFKELREEWAGIIGHHFPAPIFVRIEKVRSKKGAMWYVSKYMAKPQSAVDLTLLDFVAYPHAVGPTDPWAAFRPPLADGENSSPGRFWGVFNRGFLPYAARQMLIIRVATWRSFHDVKKMLRREWAGLNRARNKGGVVLSEQAYALWAAALRVLLNDIHDEWFAADIVTIGA